MQTRRTDRVQTWLVISSVLVTLFVIFMSHWFASPSLSAVADAVIVLLTFFTSYAITTRDAQKTARAELKDMAEASGKRIVLLSTQIKELAEEIDDFSPERQEQCEWYLGMLPAQMRRLADQAELSFEDFQMLGDLEISMPKIREQVRTNVEQATQKDRVSCPNCHADNDVVLSVTPGRTKPTKCHQCHFPFSVVRTQDGTIRVSFTDVFMIDCPKCGNKIQVKKNPKEWGTQIRNCFECYARVRVNVDTKKVESHEFCEPLSLARSAIVNGRGDCPECGFSVIFKGARNSKNEELMSCPRCTKLIHIAESSGPQASATEQIKKPNNTPEGICQPADGLPKPSA